jgi:hypothetical protein
MFSVRMIWGCHNRIGSVGAAMAGLEFWGVLGRRSERRGGVSSADVVEPSSSMTLRYTIHSIVRDTLLLLQSVVACAPCVKSTHTLTHKQQKFLSILENYVDILIWTSCMFQWRILPAHSHSHINKCCLACRVRCYSMVMGFDTLICSERIRRWIFDLWYDIGRRHSG